MDLSPQPTTMHIVVRALGGSGLFEESPLPISSHPSLQAMEIVLQSTAALSGTSLSQSEAVASTEAALTIQTAR